MKSIIFWSMASHGAGLSGGDRIFIEFAKRWSKSHKIIVVTWNEGIAMMRRNNLLETSNIIFNRINIPKVIQVNFFICYIYRIFIGLIKALSFKVAPDTSFLYSSSEFWMDALPSAILKLRHPNLNWVATWYQTAPSWWIGFGQNRYRLSALLLWLSQLPIKPLLNNLADVILVNNELEKQVFPDKPTVVVLGAVDTTAIESYQRQHKHPKKYLAVFQGRFHAQKGVVELIDIWRLVVDQRKDAKLAMIGDGPLMPRVRQRIKELNLEENVELLGYVFDGEKKYKIFSQSKLAVHPAFFDSGGMATAEAMAFGIPGIGFDLPAYRTYYPEGFVTVPAGNLQAFASVVLDQKENKKLGIQARKFIFSAYSWDYRARQILRQIAETTDPEKGRVAPR